MADHQARLDRYTTSFDDLVILCREDPEAFETLRRRILEDEISFAPPVWQGRLQALLSDRERRLGRYGSGLARYNAVVLGLLGADFPKFREGLAMLPGILTTPIGQLESGLGLESMAEVIPLFPNKK